MTNEEYADRIRALYKSVDGRKVLDEITRRAGVGQPINHADADKRLMMLGAYNFGIENIVEPIQKPTRRKNGQAK